jgi:hypothetical protein
MAIELKAEERISFCRFLRTKKMYIPALCQEGDPRLQTDTAHFWCLKTHTSVGPDNDFVHGDDCRGGRSCCETDF